MIVLLIPAYQPGSAVVDVVEKVFELQSQSAVFSWVVVVDDGSGPAFAATFARLRELRNVVVVTHAINLGKGAALRTGFNHIFVQWPETLGCVTADADGQHLAEDILRIGVSLLETPDALVLGVRQFGKGVPLRSLFGNFISNQVFRFLIGKSVGDTQTGLRGWPRRLCLRSLHVPLNGYDFELANLVTAARDEVRQVGIQTVYLPGNPSSHFNPLRDSMRIYFVFVRYCGAALSVSLIDSLFFYWVFSATGKLIWAQIAGRSVAAIVAFLLARNVVFRSDTTIPVALVKYLSLVGAMGVICYFLMQFFQQSLDVPILAAKLLSEGLLFLGNFSIQRDFIFSRRQGNK